VGCGQCCFTTTLLEKIFKWAKNCLIVQYTAGPVSYGGHNLPPLVEIGLTDLPKSGGTMARFHNIKKKDLRKAH
jgi:hypothetical protein